MIKKYKQLTLGELIKKLEALPSGTIIKGLGGLDSYRGYYDHLAFDIVDAGRTVESILMECKEAIGSTFTGYKGGEYQMFEDTPIWVAGYGCCGTMLVDIDGDTVIVCEEC